MQFALFLYDIETFHDQTEAEQMAVVGEYMAYTAELEAAGAHVSGVPLDASTLARTLMPGGAIQDGPYADTKEQLGGLYIIHAGSMDEALAWARKCPSHRHGGRIEVRPIPDYGD
ncbi:MAG: YciI family protein [Hyphomonas sp.]|nr:YciI family protein [Hyphomonas sp.]